MGGDRAAPISLCPGSRAEPGRCYLPKRRHPPGSVAARNGRSLRLVRPGAARSRLRGRGRRRCEELGRDPNVGRLLERVGEADERRLVPAPADERHADRQRPGVPGRNRDAGVAGDRGRARRPDERREVATEVAVHRIRHPRGAVRRRDDRVEVVRRERVVDRRLGGRRRELARRRAGRIGATTGFLGEVEDQRVPIGLRGPGFELRMVVVEVDQVLEGFRIARGRVGVEVRRDVVLELTEERGELRLVGRLDRDPRVVDDGRAGGLELRDRRVQDRVDLRTDRRVVRAFPPDADSGAVERICVEELRVIRERVARLVGGRGIVGVDAGQRAEEDGRVGDVAGDRAGRVLLGGDRDDARPADEPERRLDPDDAVGAGRADDRAVRLAADRDRREVCGRDDARARARAARVPIEDLRHVRLATDPAPAAGRRPGPEVCPLGQVGLADDDRARGAHLAHEERVIRG